MPTGTGQLFETVSCKHVVIHSIEGMEFLILINCLEMYCPMLAALWT